MDPYVRRCYVMKVVDGDTLDVMVDMGWYLHMGVRLRLFGVDTPELRPPMSMPDRDAHIAAARSARDFVGAWVDGWNQELHEMAWPFVIRSHKLDSFGRSLGDITPNRPDSPQWLSPLLVAEGHGEAV